MGRSRNPILPIVALMLVGVAVLTVPWLSRTGLDDHMTALDSLGCCEGHDCTITYRFLNTTRFGGTGDQLVLGRFQGGEFQGPPTWVFHGMDQWHGWAPSIFEREVGWVAEDQPGYRISRWLDATESGCCDGDHLFWSLQALCFLDPESLINEIKMIESSGRTLRIYTTQGASDYDYASDTLYWNPVATRYVPTDERLDRKWFKTDPLVALAHQLNHAWHDLCREGDGTDAEARERTAVMAENRIRHKLFLMDPTQSDLYPRPGCRDTCPDIPGRSVQEAWWNYTGRVQ